MSRRAVSREKLVAVADAVRKKTGGTDALTLDEMPGAIAGIEGGGGGVIFDDLPAGYGKGGFVYFSGDQIIDTQIVCTEKTKIRTVFTRELDTSQYFFGVESSGNTASVTAYFGGNWRFGNKYVNKSSNVAADADVVYTAIVDKSRIFITNRNSSISNVTSFQAIGSLMLGAARTASGTIGEPSFVGKVFQFEMWSDSELVLNLVPVVSFEGVYRFWDSVSGEFFDSITDVPLSGGLYS